MKKTVCENMKHRIFDASASLLTLWLCSALMLAATPMTLSQAGGKCKALLVGMDYTASPHKWFRNATAMKEALFTWTSWRRGEIKVLGPKVSAIDIVGNLSAMNIGANDLFIFYYSGHANRWNGNEKAPALNTLEEGLKPPYVSAKAFGVTDDNLTACFKKANVSPSATKIVILDCCYSFGFWNGYDEGDMEKVRNIALLASTREDKISPASSNFTYWLVDGMKKPQSGYAPADTNPPNNIVTAQEWFNYAKNKIKETGQDLPIYGYRKQAEEPPLEDDDTLAAQTWTQNEPDALDTDGALQSEVSNGDGDFGGIAIQTNNPVSLAPYIGLASTTVVATVAAVTYVKRRKKKH